MRGSRGRSTILAVTMMAAGLVAARGEPQTGGPAGAAFIRDGFESERASWQQEYTDTTVRVLAHERSDRAAHDGRTSERFRFEAGSGSRFFVSRALPRIPVTDDLAITLYVRSNRTGAQLFGWVVLPSDIDPETRAPSYLLVPGTVFERPDRWQKLELADMRPAIEEQARALRASTRRPVKLDGAYLERVVVNLMGGTGETDTFLDDLSVGPVPPDLVADRAPAAREGPIARPPGRRAGAEEEPDESEMPAVRLRRGVFERLVPGGRYVPWFPTAIEAPGADPATLRRHGFDVLVTEADPDVKRIQPVLEGDRPMYLLPRLSDAAAEEDGPQRVLREISEYPLRRSVLMWSIGEHLGRRREAARRAEEVRRVREVLSSLHDAEDGPRLTTATVDGELRLYARPPSDLDVIGLDLPVWGGTVSYWDGLNYLKQRRAVAARTNLEVLFWARLPATAPPEVLRNIWGTDEVPGWGLPPIQPEQLRLSTYMALAGGARGITFVGDAELTRTAGEPLLLEMAFLNAEIDLFEAILAGNTRPIAEYAVFDPDPPDRPYIPNVNQKRMPLVRETEGKPGLRAAAIPLAGSKGALLLVADFDVNGQWQPAQLAYHDLAINPRLPQAVQFLEVSPGEARFLEQKPDDRIPGGTRVTLPDFGVTSMILCTTDMALCERIQRNVASIRPMAVQWAIRQAELQYALARDGHERLKVDGHLILGEEELKIRRERGIDGRPTDAEDQLLMAEKFIKGARAAYEAQDYATGWAEARRAGRPLRNLMSGYWKQAVVELNKSVAESFYGPKPRYAPGEVRPYPNPPILLTPDSCPPAISFFTLPQLHIWKDWVHGVAGYRFGPNRVPSGTFDDAESIQSAGWIDVSHQYEGIVRELKVPKRERGPHYKPKPEAEKRGVRAKKNEIKYAEEPLDEDDHVLKLSVRASDPKKIDELDPFLAEPAAAVLSPPVRVAANNLIRISVLVKKPMLDVPGRGGVVIRDTIGGEPFQYRFSSSMPGYSRVVLYRKAPADGDLRVMLGLAGFGDAVFDDFRLQVVEESFPDPERPVDPGLVRDDRPARSSPRAPDPRTPAATAVVPPPNRRDR